MKCNECKDFNCSKNRAYKIIKVLKGMDFREISDTVYVKDIYFNEDFLMTFRAFLDGKVCDSDEIYYTASLVYAGSDSSLGIYDTCSIELFQDMKGIQGIIELCQGELINSYISYKQHKEEL